MKRCWKLFWAWSLGLSSAALATQDLSVTANASEATHLMCTGGGSANKINSTEVYGDGGSAQILSQRESNFEDQVNVDLNWSDPKASRIRLPRQMLPVLRGGKDGWFELDNLKRNDSEITATAQVNVLNSPKVRIDRSTGAININGKAGNFSGRCEPYDPATVRKKF